MKSRSASVAITAMFALMLAQTAAGNECLRTLENAEIVAQLRKVLSGTQHADSIAEVLRERCPESTVITHKYVGKPLHTVANGDVVTVRAWVKITAGPYRFWKRLFVRTHVIATILLDEEGQPVGYDVEHQYDSL